LHTCATLASLHYAVKPAIDEMTEEERRRWVTSLEVAQLAGVSRSAVSRCFTPGASIAERTKQRVLKAADQLGYRPNAIARSLNTRRSGLVGVVVADVGNPFYARLVEALAIEIQERGRAPVVFVAKEASATDALLRELLSFQVDGVLVASATLSLRVTQLYRSAGTPIILLDRMAGDGEVVTGDVSADNVAAAVMVAELFATTGCLRPAFLAGLENTSTSLDRAAGFVAGLERHGLKLSARDVGGYTYVGGQAAARRLLGKRDRPDAIFCANDEMALAMVDVARCEFGLRIPSELSIAGFDNTASSALAAYNLTTIDQSLERMAVEAVSMLEASFGASFSAERLRIPCRLIRRTTTR
jgi:DNA-binding LacI/PurR family transcriptional regulator